MTDDKPLRMPMYEYIWHLEETTIPKLGRLLQLPNLLSSQTHLDQVKALSLALIALKLSSIAPDGELSGNFIIGGSVETRPEEKGGNAS